MTELGRKGLSHSETLFFVVLLGMVTANFSKVNIPLREALFWLPQQTAVILGWQSPGYSFLAAIWVCLLLPLLLLLPGLLVFRLGRLSRSLSAAGAEKGELSPELPRQVKKEPFWSSLGQLALPFIPLILTAHLILALVKLNTKGGYLPLVLQDPTGVQSYLAIAVMKTLEQPTALVSLDLFKWLILALLLGGYLVGLFGARRVTEQLFDTSNRRSYFIASLVGLSLCGSLYLDTIIRWLFIR